MERLILSGALIFISLISRPTCTADDQTFSVHSLDAQAQVVCLHSIEAQACAIAIISGPNTNLNYDVATYMWTHQNKKIHCLGSDWQQNTDKIKQLYHIRKIKLLNKDSRNLKKLPTRLSWLSCTYGDTLSYAAYVFSSDKKGETDIPVGKKIDITKNTVSTRDDAIIFNADGKIIQFHIPHK